MCGTVTLVGDDGLMGEVLQNDVKMHIKCVVYGKCPGVNKDGKFLLTLASGLRGFAVIGYKSFDPQWVCMEQPTDGQCVPMTTRSALRL